jgi:hypothetical protein
VLRFDRTCYNGLALLQERSYASRGLGDGLDCHGGTGEGDLCRTTVVLGEELLLVGCGRPVYLDLGLDGRRVILTQRGNLAWVWANVEAAVAAVVADAILDVLRVGDVVHDHRAVVDVGDVGIDVGDGAVVVEAVTLPVAAIIACADVSITVINPTVEADMDSPIAVVEAVTSTVKAPVGRCPKRAVVRRRAPYAGGPIVATVAVSPIAGRPEVVGFGSGWLFVLGQRRRRLGSVDGLLPVGFSLVVGGVVVIVAAGVILLDGRGLLLSGLLLVALALLAGGIRRTGAQHLGGSGGG